jgi:hypothetical protein
MILVRSFYRMIELFVIFLLLVFINYWLEYKPTQFSVRIHFGTLRFADEEWNEHPSEDSLFLVQPTVAGRSSSWKGPGADLSLPRARRVHSSGIESPSSPVANIAGETHRMVSSYATILSILNLCLPILFLFTCCLSICISIVGVSPNKNMYHR